jgi:group I intron endonuclease
MQILDSIKRDRAGVYQIKNSVNDKIYIGSSVNIYNRAYTHETKLEKKKHSNQHLENSYHKYGFDKFQFSVIEYCHVDNITEREQYYIDKMSPEYNKREIAQNNTGVRKSEETRKKISESLKERYKNGLETYKQQHLWEEVEQYDLDGNLVNTFKNKATADRKVGKGDNKICKAVKKDAGVYYGYQWKVKGSDKKIKKFASKSPKSKVTKVTNVKTGESKIFRSFKEMCKTLDFPRGSVIKAKKADRLYKGKYRFEYISSPVIE